VPEFCYQGAIGFELWTMSDNILFDNIIITDSLIVAEQYAADSFDIKRLKLDKQAVSTLSRICPY
jgi:calnexin